MMTKFPLLIALSATLGLVACNKPQESIQNDTPTTTTQTATAQSSHNDDDHHEQDHDDHHNTHDNHDDTHDDEHEHNHAHNHSHMGDKYQCGNKILHIAIHTHEGEMEAHLTDDNITYDLNADVQTKGRFTTDDGINGEDVGMALIIDDNTAKITTLDNTPLLDCVKQ